MRRIILVTLLSVLLLTGLWSREGYNDSLSLGFKLEDINDDLGIHLDIVSPTIFNYFNLRLSGGMVNEKPDFSNEHYSFLFGLRGYGAPVNDILKLYGEFGLLAIYDYDNPVFGAYGLFGFEFYTARDYLSPVSYFIELGTHSTAEDLYKGFTTNVGLRYYI